MIDLKNRDFLKLLDFTPEEIFGLIDLAADLKEKKKQGIAHRYCEGKNIALIFEKTSTRTRCKGLRSPHTTLACPPHIWIRQDPRSEKGKYCGYSKCSDRHV